MILLKQQVCPRILQEIEKISANILSDLASNYFPTTSPRLMPKSLSAMCAELHGDEMKINGLQKTKQAAVQETSTPETFQLGVTHYLALAC